MICSSTWTRLEWSWGVIANKAATSHVSKTALSHIDASEFAPRHLYYRPLLKIWESSCCKMVTLKVLLRSTLTMYWTKIKTNQITMFVQATVPPKDILILLPYLGLHSNQVTKRLKSCVYNFYSSFVNLKIIYTRLIKSYFPYNVRLKRSQRSKIIYYVKLVAGTVTDESYFPYIQRSLETISEVQGHLLYKAGCWDCDWWTDSTLAKQNEDSMTVRKKRIFQSPR